MGKNIDKKETFLKLILLNLIIAHWVVIIGNLLAFLVLPFAEKWYVALPLMSYIGLLTFSAVLDCPITKLENRIRKHIDLPQISGFIGHYLLKPLKKAQVREKIRRRRLSSMIEAGTANTLGCLDK